MITRSQKRKLDAYAHADPYDREWDDCPWVYHKRQVKAIFGSNTALRKREIDGVITDGEGTVFKKEMLDAWFSKPRMAPPTSIANNTIYVALDPNGGANKSNTPGSNTAIVSFFVTNGCFVVGEGVCGVCGEGERGIGLLARVGRAGAERHAARVLECAFGDPCLEVEPLRFARDDALDCGQQILLQERKHGDGIGKRRRCVLRCVVLGCFAAVWERMRRRRFAEKELAELRLEYQRKEEQRVHETARRVVVLCLHRALKQPVYVVEVLLGDVALRHWYAPVAQYGAVIDDALSNERHDDALVSRGELLAAAIGEDVVRHVALAQRLLDDVVRLLKRRKLGPRV